MHVSDEITTKLFAVFRAVSDREWGSGESTPQKIPGAASPRSSVAKEGDPKVVHEQRVPGCGEHGNGNFAQTIDDVLDARRDEVGHHRLQRNCYPADPKKVITLQLGQSQGAGQCREHLR
ncbi:hypothetical protein GCM10009563_16630 [Subtercola frigoramans]